MTISITGVFGGGGGGRGAGGFSPKEEGWLYMLANALKRLAGKVVEAVKAILVSVLGAILSFLKKTVAHGL